MRKVDVVRPPINYVVVMKTNSQRQVAWFVDEDDAHDFLFHMVGSDKYEIAEVRK